MKKVLKFVQRHKSHKSDNVDQHSKDSPEKSFNLSHQPLTSKPNNDLPVVIYPSQSWDLNDQRKPGKRWRLHRRNQQVSSPSSTVSLGPISATSYENSPIKNLDFDCFPTKDDINHHDYSPEKDSIHHHDSSTLTDDKHHRVSSTTKDSLHHQVSSPTNDTTHHLHSEEENEQKEQHVVQLSFKQQCAQSIDVDECNNVTAAVDALDKSGSALFAKGNHQEALHRFEQALALKKKSLQDHSLAWEKFERNLSNKESNPSGLLQVSDKESEKLNAMTSLDLIQSHPTYKATKRISTPILSQDEIDNYRRNLIASVATSINNMTYLKQQNGESSTEETLASYMQSLQMKLQVLGPEHLSVGKTLNNIGSVFYVQKKFDSALQAYLDAHCIMECALGHFHLDVATVASNIGDTYRCMENADDKALEYYGLALDIRWKLLPHNHPKVARLMELTANLELKQGNVFQQKPDADSDDDDELRESEHTTRGEIMVLKAKAEEDMKFLEELERSAHFEVVQDQETVLREIQQLREEAKVVSTSLYSQLYAKCDGSENSMSDDEFAADCPSQATESNASKSPDQCTANLITPVQQSLYDSEELKFSLEHTTDTSDLYLHDHPIARVVATDEQKSKAAAEEMPPPSGEISHNTETVDEQNPSRNDTSNLELQDTSDLDLRDQPIAMAVSTADDTSREVVEELAPSCESMLHSAEIMLNQPTSSKSAGIGTTAEHTSVERDEGCPTTTVQVSHRTEIILHNQTSSGTRDARYQALAAVRERLAKIRAMREEQSISSTKETTKPIRHRSYMNPTQASAAKMAHSSKGVHI